MTCDTDLQHGRSASHLPREAPWPRQGDGRFRPRQSGASQPHAPPTCHDWRLFRAHQRHPGTTPLDHTAHRKLPWICGRSDHCQIGAEARPERGRHPSRLSPPHPGLGHGRWFHYAPGSQPRCPCSRDWLHSRHHRNRHRPRHACPREVSEVMTMPRTVDEILAHANELATRFENYEPVAADEVDVVALAALRDAVAEQAQAERHVLDAVRGARDAGMSWAAIGNMVGTSGEAARQRYQPLVA